MGRLRARPDPRPLCADAGPMRAQGCGLGRHHPGPAGKKGRRHLQLPVDHRGAGTADRLQPRLLRNRRRRGGTQGHDRGHQSRRPERQDHRRADLHGQLQLPEEVLREDRQRPLLRDPGPGERRPPGRTPGPDAGGRQCREQLHQDPRCPGRRPRVQGQRAPRPAVRTRRRRGPAQGRPAAQGEAGRGHWQAAG
ncbi:hypothetical protein D9M70_521520 [compost metagenome]